MKFEKVKLNYSYNALEPYILQSLKKHLKEGY